MLFQFELDASDLDLTNAVVLTQVDLSIRTVHLENRFDSLTDHMHMLWPMNVRVMATRYPKNRKTVGNWILS